jgi:hypothetical protein
MDAMQVNAWILLSIGEAATGRLQDILGAADAINHAVPTLRELRDSIGRLRAQGLVAKERDGYVLTAQGRAMISGVQSSESKFDRWTRLAAALSQRPSRPFEPEPLDPDEVRRADNAHARDFWKAYRELRKRDP